MDAGKLKEPVAVLGLTETAEGWRWEAVRETWARVEEKTGRNLFSSVGLGAKSLGLTLRRQELTLHNAILWRGKHCFLTDIRENGRLYLDIDAALVEVVMCRGDVHRETPGKVFPGVLTEKYLRYEQGAPMTAIGREYVLVTPKPVTLQRSGLVEVAGAPWVVRLDHPLDPYKNEYEIYREDEG